MQPNCYYVQLKFILNRVSLFNWLSGVGFKVDLLPLQGEEVMLETTAHTNTERERERSNYHYNSATKIISEHGMDKNKY